MPFIDDIHDESDGRVPKSTIKEGILIVIKWCDEHPEQKILKISWLFTLRAKHLAAALRVLLGIIPD